MSGLLTTNWSECSLGQVVEIIRGVTFPASSKSYELTDEFIACLRTSHIQEKLLWSDIYFIPRSYVKRSEQIVQANDIIMSMACKAQMQMKAATGSRPTAICTTRRTADPG